MDRSVSLLLFVGSCKSVCKIGGDLNMQNRNGVRTAQHFDYIAQLEFVFLFLFLCVRHLYFSNGISDLQSEISKQKKKKKQQQQNQEINKTMNTFHLSSWWWWYVCIRIGLKRLRFYCYQLYLHHFEWVLFAIICWQLLKIKHTIHKVEFKRKEFVKRAMKNAQRKSVRGEGK